MSERKQELVVNEIYHVFNRGTDKRTIFLDAQDFLYFLDSLQILNLDYVEEGKRTMQYKKNRGELEKARVLVEIIAYCLNPNHFHLMLRQIADNGISRFMQRVGTSYAMYFNQKYNRSGSLFQGKFKSVHVATDGQLNHLSVYINLNNRVHKITSAKQYRSSWHEYAEVDFVGAKICSGTGVVLGNFKNKKDYEKFAETKLGGIVEKRNREKEPEKSVFLE